MKKLHLLFAFVLFATGLNAQYQKYSSNYTYQIKPVTTTFYNPSYSNTYYTPTKPKSVYFKPVKYYVNSFGQTVQSPTYYKSTPKGATALCRNGNYSFSRNSRGTCSHHGGVAKWL